MKYLRYVLSESLHLTPVETGSSRFAEQDTVLSLGGGPNGTSPAFDPKGNMVADTTWSLHRRRDFSGGDADETKPEQREPLRPGWEYLPFHGGPRIRP